MVDRPKWPWLGDRPVDRARRIANTLLAELPDTARELYVRRAHALGETWLGGDLLRWTPEDVLAPGEAARLVDATPATLRSWIRLGVLARTGRGYRARDVLDAAAEVRRRRTMRRGRDTAMDVAGVKA